MTKMEVEEEDTIVVFTDDDGNEFYYREDLVIEIEDKKFAVLVPVSAEITDDCDECGCGCGGEIDTDEEGDIYIARIEADENGEETYVDPTDEEFEQVQQAYEDIIAEDILQDVELDDK